jgi:hypothetical protein
MNTKPLTYKVEDVNFPIANNLFFIFDSEFIKGLTIGIKFPCVVRMFVGSNEVVSVTKNNAEVLTIGKDSVIGDYFEIKVNENKLFFTQYADNLVSRFVSSVVNIFLPSLHNVKCNIDGYCNRFILTKPDFYVIQNYNAFITDFFDYSVSNNSNCNVKLETNLSYSDPISQWGARYLITCNYNPLLLYKNIRSVWWQWFITNTWLSRYTWADVVTTLNCWWQFPGNIWLTRGTWS